MLILLSFGSESEKNKFEYIYAQYKRLMLHKAFEILKDHMLAEDAVSESLLRVYKNLHKIGEPSENKALAFVITIVKNTSLTMLSKEKKKPPDQYYDGMDEEADEFDLEKYIISEISVEKIYSVLNLVQEELRSVFILKFAYDLPHREIGRLLHISENNVTVRLHRAKKKLVEILAKEGYAYEKR